MVTVDSVLMLMDMFAMPYKAVVLRLFESGNISHQQAEKLLEVGSADVMERVSLTGKAKRWQLDGKGTESFGTLLEKVEYNRQHEYLTESRENEDVAYLAQLKKEYGLDERGKRCYSCSWKSSLYLRFAEERSEGYCNHAVCCGASHVL